MLVILALLAVVPLFLLVAYGGRRLRAKVPSMEDVYAGPMPWTGVVVPVKGAPEGLAACLEALLHQDHGAYEVVFVVEDLADPAVAVIQAVLDAAAAKGLKHGQMAVAGRSEGCGQKNWNQLAGLAALDCRAEILAFCDSTHSPRPDWLRRLTSPIALGRSEAATAYHHVFHASSTLAATGRTISVLALYMMQEIPAITQPWGGSMAISRRSFERLDVAAFWARNVVDDVSLALLLEGAGLRAEPVAGAAMQTHLQHETFSGWRVWLERQWLYLKFIFPGSWKAVGVLLWLQAALLLLAVVFVLGGLFGWVAGGTAAAGWTYLLTLLLLGLWARESHPRPGGTGRWLAGFFATLLMAAWCHVATVPKKHIVWGGVRYEVGPQGEVLALERRE